MTVFPYPLKFKLDGFSISFREFSKEGESKDGEPAQQQNFLSSEFLE